MANTHRVFMEHDNTGQVKLMFRGTRAECMGYWNEWLNHQKIKHNPGDEAKYLRPGWSMYVCEIEQSTVLTGRERQYRVLDEEAVNPDDPHEASEAEARRAIMALIHFEHPLAKVWKNVYGDNTPMAVRHARQQALDRWIEQAGEHSVTAVIDRLVKEETSEQEEEPASAFDTDTEEEWP